MLIFFLQEITRLDSFVTYVPIFGSKCYEDGILKTSFVLLHLNNWGFFFIWDLIMNLIVILHSNYFVELLTYLQRYLLIKTSLYSI